MSYLLKSIVTYISVQIDEILVKLGRADHYLDPNKNWVGPHINNSDF